MKINDWSSIQTLFDELNKRLDKIHKTPGSTGEPRKYIKMLVELEVRMHAPDAAMWEMEAAMRMAWWHGR